jgi:hypothetical protein
MCIQNVIAAPLAATNEGENMNMVIFERDIKPEAQGKPIQAMTLGDLDEHIASAAYYADRVVLQVGDAKSLLKNRYGALQ